MSTQPKIKIHLPFLALHFIGTMLIALGAWEMVAVESLLPESLRFEGHYIALIAVGLLLTLPLMVWIIRSKIKRGQA